MAQREAKHEHGAENEERERQKARRPALLAGRVEVIGYENSFYFFKEFYFAGGESNPRPFRL